MNIGNTRKDVRSSSPRRRGRDLRFAPKVESLDQRVVCAGIAIGVTDLPIGASSLLEVDTVTPLIDSSTTPANAASATQSGFELQFNQPVAPSSVHPNDLEVDRIGADGSVTPLSSVTATDSESVDSSANNPNGIRLVFPTPLDLGAYQIVLKGSNTLASVDGKARTLSTDQVLTHFSVGHSAVPTHANNLGTIDASTTSLPVPVSTMNPNGVMEKVVLGAGQTWTFSPQFAKQDPDNYRVELDDSQGQLIASVRGAELSQIPDQLGSGTYYFEVFRMDSSTVAPISPVELTITANPLATSSETVTSVVPLNANGLTDDPDSIDVQFAGAAPSAQVAPWANTTYVLINDQSTQTPLAPIEFDPTTNQMRLAFTSDLPTGHYTLQATTSGWTSFAFQSQKETLGSFDTVFHPLPVDNLGTIYPQTSDSTKSGTQASLELKNETDLTPGSSVSQKFSIIKAEEYRFNLSNDAVSGQLIELSPDGSILSSAVSIENGLGKDLYLNPGIYEFVAVNTSETSQSVGFAVTPIQTGSEILSSGGVVQMPASIDRTTLVGGGAIAISSQFSPSVVQVPMTPTATSASHESNLTASASVELSGSFSLAAFNPVPLGSFASGQEASPSGNPASQIGIETMVMAVNSTIFLKPSPTVSEQPWSRVQLDSRARLVATPGSLPNAQSVPATDIRQTELVDLAQPAMINELTLIETLTAENSEAIKSDIEETSEFEEVVTSTQALSVMSDSSLEVSGLGSPIGIILGACVVYRQIKNARATRGGSFWNRPWTTPSFGSKLGLRRTSKPCRHSFV